LNTPGKLTDPKGKSSGWQGSIGDVANRDIKYFDAPLAYFEEKYRSDTARIYSMGHSNGGEFTYVLWAARGEEIAAVAPMAVVLGLRKDRAALKAKPVFLVAGRNDTLIKFAWQEAMINYIKKLNNSMSGIKGECEFITEYTSKDGEPLATFIDNGGHIIPGGAILYIIEFFKRYTLY
jgi:polyhydroxybutyrate depolymerase